MKPRARRLSWAIVLLVVVHGGGVAASDLVQPRALGRAATARHACRCCPSEAMGATCPMAGGQGGSQCSLGCRQAPRAALLIDAVALPGLAFDGFISWTSSELSTREDRAVVPIAVAVLDPPPRSTASHS